MDNPVKKPGVITTVIDGYRFTWTHRARAMRLSLPVLPWIVPQWLYISALPLIPHHPGGVGMWERQAIFLVTIILGMVGALAVTIPWYRMVLIGPQDTMQVRTLHFRRNEWQFFGRLLFYMVIYLPCFYGALIAGVFFPALLYGVLKHLGIALVWIVVAMAGPVLGMLCLFVAIVAAVTRLYLYFPAKAVGDYMNFRQAFRRGKGIGMRLTGAVWLCLLPFIALPFGVDYLQHLAAGHMPQNSAWLPARFAASAALGAVSALFGFAGNFVACYVVAPFYRYVRDGGSAAV